MKLMYIPCNELTKYTDYVKSLGVLHTLKGIIKLYQIISVVHKKIAYRDISCVCTQKGFLTAIAISLQHLNFML